MSPASKKSIFLVDKNFQKTKTFSPSIFDNNLRLLNCHIISKLYSPRTLCDAKRFFWPPCWKNVRYIPKSPRSESEEQSKRLSHPKKAGKVTLDRMNAVLKNLQKKSNKFQTSSLTIETQNFIALKYWVLSEKVEKKICRKRRKKFQQPSRKNLP